MILFVLFLFLTPAGITLIVIVGLWRRQSAEQSDTEQRIEELERRVDELEGR